MESGDWQGLILAKGRAAEFGSRIDADRAGRTDAPHLPVLGRLEHVQQVKAIQSHRFRSFRKARTGQMHDAGNLVSLPEGLDGRQIAPSTCSTKIRFPISFLIKAG